MGRLDRLVGEFFDALSRSRRRSTNQPLSEGPALYPELPEARGDLGGTGDLGGRH
jgi:hypothetical protein